MRVIIDRFEDGFAVVELECGKMANLPIDLVPDGAKEGDAILITIDYEYTKLKQERIKELFDNLSS